MPQEGIRAALERAEADLRQVGTTTALAMAKNINQALVASPPLPVDRCRPVLQDLLKFLNPQTTTTLAAEISQAVDPNATLSPDEYRKLASKVLSLLTPPDSSLAAQIEQLLLQPNLSIDQAKPLLQQAATLLKPKALALAEKLQQAIPATLPLATDDWRKLLKEVQDYFAPETSTLIDNINKALAADPVVPLARWKALLSEALGLLYDRTDTDFDTLISWQNKTVWLVGTGSLLIVSLAAALQHEVLFLVGATGGLLSRLSRSLQRADVPTDYGASWTTLFLSPVVGALAGWSGVLLVVVAVELNVLGAVFKVDWCDPYCPLALGLAFLLGFSERAFDAVLSQLENKIQGQQSTSTSGQPASLSIVVPPNFGDAKVSQAYDKQLSVSGGTSPYKWSLLNGSLPGGLSLDPAGRIAGTATTSGQSKFTLQVTDAGKATKSQEFTITVSP
ncbi:MAG: Ig domain-containing protein [Terriglobales bacterium]